MSLNPFESLNPSIRKAKFILQNDRAYTLEFDNNIQMYELKAMIQKAAHLNRRTFRLFLLSNGEEYTKYNTEIFSSLFPNPDLVIFKLELTQDEESFDQSELVLQMNSPCDVHKDKFLMYYCFTCSKSICGDCFSFGEHKNHLIQDKCFYLLPSKYLVEKIFKNWSQNPYEEFNISVDLTELKNKVNSVYFKELFEMLKKLQEKCNLLIDEYNKVNEASLSNIRNSVRDIKLSCIKALDGLKNDLNIQNIVNNQDIFIQFDKAYKELGKAQNEKFKNNLKNFGELNKNVSLLVENLITQIYSVIYKALNNMLEDSQFENVKNQINMKLVKPHSEGEILSQLSEHKKNRNSTMIKNNIKSNNFAKAIAQSVKNRLNSDPSKGKNIIQDINPINPFNIQEDNKINNNLVNFGYNNNNTTVQNSFPNNLDNIAFGVKNETNIIPNIKRTTFTSAQSSGQKITTNIGVNNSNLFSSSSKEKNSINQMNQMNQINSSFNNISNISNNNNNMTSSQISNLNIINQTLPQIHKTAIVPNLITNNANTNNNTNNIDNGIIHQHQHNIITYSIPQNNNNSLDNSNYETIQYIESVQKMNNNNTDIKKYLNSKYILAPVPQTNSIKIITENDSEESTLPLKFPENFGFNTFFLDCAHCNCEFNNCLYVSGGIESTSEKKRSNVLLCIDITQNDELKVKKMANMNSPRCGHSMISDGKYIYVLGGEDTDSVERYDIENNIWENLPPMICKRMYPILHINKGYLYAFFGKYKNGEYPCFIERLNIGNKNDNIKADWEMIIFSNPKNLDVRIYGCAVLEFNEMLYFFGGKVEEKTTNKIFFYNFEQKIIEKEETEVLWNEYFRENKLYQIGGRVVQCSDNKYFGVYITIEEQD